jgi:hypothetical protein
MTTSQIKFTESDTNIEHQGLVNLKEIKAFNNNLKGIRPLCLSYINIMESGF